MPLAVRQHVGASERSAQSGGHDAGSVIGAGRGLAGDRGDLAEAAAIVLASEGRFDGPTPPLTASQALDLSDLAGIASELLGKTVRRETITDEELEARLAARGAGRAAAIVLGLYRASRNGEFSAVDPTLSGLLRRAPTTLREVLGPVLGTSSRAS